MSTTQHSLRLQNYTVPMWPLVVHIRACFVRSNLKYASGSKIPRTKSGVKSCEKKSDIILTLATCCDGIRGVRRNDGNYLTHIQHRYTGGGAIMSPNDFSFLHTFPFFPSFIRCLLSSRIAFLLSFSLPFFLSSFLTLVFPSFFSLTVPLFVSLRTLSYFLFHLFTHVRLTGVLISVA